MANDRPALSGEYEVAIGIIDLTRSLTFSETPYPQIVGSFTVIACTRNLEIHPPVAQFKFVSNGYNPVAQIVPADSVPGSFRFESHDMPVSNPTAQFNGQLCVARIITRIDDVIVSTEYLSYCVPVIDTTTGDGDEPGSIRGGGPFALLSRV